MSVLSHNRTSDIYSIINLETIVLPFHLINYQFQVAGNRSNVPSVKLMPLQLIPQSTALAFCFYFILVLSLVQNKIIKLIRIKAKRCKTDYDTVSRSKLIMSHENFIQNFTKAPGVRRLITSYFNKVSVWIRHELYCSSYKKLSEK